MVTKNYELCLQNMYDEKDQTCPETAICVQVVQAFDCPQCKSSRGLVYRILKRATVVNLTWPLPDGVTDTEFKSTLLQPDCISIPNPNPPNLERQRTATPSLNSKTLTYKKMPTPKIVIFLKPLKNRGRRALAKRSTTMANLHCIRYPYWNTTIRLSHDLINHTPDP